MSLLPPYELFHLKLDAQRAISSLLELQSLIDPLNPEYDLHKAQFEFETLKPILHNILYSTELEDTINERSQAMQDMIDDQALSLKSLL
jgi:hypothetical protein